MERHFALPIALAAAIHGGLLFGIPKTHRIAPPVERDLRVVDLISMPKPDPVEEVVVESAPSERPKPVVDPVVIPRGAELPSINPDTSFVIKPPPIPDGPVGDVRQILPTHFADGGGPRAWGPNTVLSSAMLDNSPRTRYQVAPTYPFEAKREGMHGEVMVEFMVDESGNVREPVVVKSTHHVFEEATLRAVAKWKFEPGRRNGQIVRFRMMVPVVFNLSE